MSLHHASYYKCGIYCSKNYILRLLELTKFEGQAFRLLLPNQSFSVIKVNGSSPTRAVETIFLFIMFDGVPYMKSLAARKHTHMGKEQLPIDQNMASQVNFNSRLQLVYNQYCCL